MIATPTNLPDVLILEPKVFGDHRGFFFESYNQKVLNQAIGQDVQFVQDNHSRSARGVLRGLHRFFRYQDSSEKTYEAYKQQFNIGRRTLLDVLDATNGVKLIKSGNLKMADIYGQLQPI